jgi:hypothetical protein
MAEAVLLIHYFTNPEVDQALVEGGSSLVGRFVLQMMPPAIALLLLLAWPHKPSPDAP